LDEKGGETGRGREGTLIRPEQRGGGEKGFSLNGKRHEVI